MNKKLFLLFVALVLILVSFYLPGNVNLPKVENVAAAPPNYTLHFCGYKDITSVFTREMRLPSQSSILDIQRLNYGYYSVIVVNGNGTKESYLYSFGADRELGTRDDYSFFLGHFSTYSEYTSPVVVLSNGSASTYNLYWANNTLTSKEIKSCRLWRENCLNTATKAILPLSPLTSFLPSHDESKLYFVHNQPILGGNPNQYYSLFRSCSTSQNSSDRCSGNFSNYSVYPSSYPFNVRYIYYKTVNSIGFVVLPLYPPNYPLSIAYPDNTYLFDINRPAPQVIQLEGGFDLNSFISLNVPGALIGVKNDFNSTNDTLSILDISLNLTTDLDNLRRSYHDSHFIGDNLVVVYGDDISIYAKIIGVNEKEIYINSTAQPGTTMTLSIKGVLTDNSVIAMNPWPDQKIIRFTCKP